MQFIKYMKIFGKGTPEIIEQVRNGKLSITAAYDKVKDKEKTVTVLFDVKDPRFKNHPMHVRKIQLDFQKIEKLYDFMSEVLAAKHHDQEICATFKKQLVLHAKALTIMLQKLELSDS